MLADPPVRALDWEKPMVLMQCLTMHHVGDELDPWSLMRRYVEALLRGSYVMFSHLSNPQDGSETEEIAAEMSRQFSASSFATGWFRTPDEIRRMTDGLTLIEPGLVALEVWWPSGPREASPADPVALGAVGYKP